MFTPSQLRYRSALVPLIALVALMSLTAPAAATSELQQEVDRTDALFEGRVINMASDWEEAEACIVWPEKLSIPECFRTEAEMDARIAELERSSGAESGRTVARASNCSGYLRLYDGTSYSGQVLYIRGRLQWIDLAPLGFNQKTSSFKIGPCSAYLADLAGGGGAWYPTGSTQAYDVASSMISGWNNDVSSLYIT